MILFIALPIVSIFVQSLFIQHEQVLVVAESCGPFGCKESTAIDLEATEQLRKEAPLGKFNGLGTYANRSHLAFDEIVEAWANTCLLYTSPSPRDGLLSRMPSSA